MKLSSAFFALGLFLVSITNSFSMPGQVVSRGDAYMDVKDGKCVVPELQMQSEFQLEFSDGKCTRESGRTEDSLPTSSCSGLIIRERMSNAFGSACDDKTIQCDCFKKKIVRRRWESLKQNISGLENYGVINSLTCGAGWLDTVEMSKLECLQRFPEKYRDQAKTIIESVYSEVKE